MAMTMEGGRTLVKTMTERHGSYEAYRQHMRAKASVGGQKGAKDGVIKGFAKNRELAKTAGALGGKNSRRNRVKETA